ncbi:MAG: hypothetical protein PSX36_04765 [bacterium]|nr:hypothetical protein [bacterium]
MNSYRDRKRKRGTVYNASAPCQQLSGAKDGYGNYYIPPVDNYMTYFQGCRSKFTQEQLNFMALTILNQLLYLH